MSGVSDSLSNLSVEQKRSLLKRLLRQQAQDRQAAREPAPVAPPPQILPDPERRHEPFPLTDIQQAYWVGRNSAFEIGSVGIHGYFEVEAADADLARLTWAWQQVIGRHDMLRAVVLPDGQQHILERVPAYEIELFDLRGQERAAIEAHLEAVRERLSHQLFAPDCWPMFEIKATRLGERRVRLHISIDGLHFDLWSVAILFEDWLRFYEGSPVEPPQLGLSYRDYALALERAKRSSAYQEALAYWRERAGSLPSAPALPLKQSPGSIARARFVRRSARLESHSWQGLKRRAAEYGLTPSGVLLAAYAEVLGTWSASLRFTVNVTLANRLPLHAEVNRVAGDFTSMTLLEVDNSEPASFADRALRIQEQLWRDLEYRYVSGVEILRERARATGRVTDAVMPIVYTGTLGTQGYLSLNRLGEVIYCVTQTPQVLLDEQVFEDGDALLVSWDAVEEAFHDGVLDEMFAAHGRLLRRLADEESAWRVAPCDLLDDAHRRRITAINDTSRPFPDGPLQTLFEEQARQRPQHAAVIAPRRRLAYAELDERSNQVGRLLRQMGVGANAPVAVVMEKGWEQVVAVLGILKAGAAYLPIDADFPQERIDLLLEDGQVSAALTQSWLAERLKRRDSIRWLAVDALSAGHAEAQPLQPAQGPADLAYVLYTSGSTGTPKGVMIEHRSVVNRMSDVCRRFHVGPEDRALALTALQHDLSVFDLMGMLAVAGGGLVLPAADAARDPAHWADLIARQRVTV